MQNNVVALNPQRSLRDYSPQQMALIQRTVAKDTTGDEFDLFMEVCRRVGLDPFRKQIHCVIHNKDKKDKRQLTIITGIDGFRAVAARCGDYRPDDEEAVYEIDPEEISPLNPKGIVKATVRAHKRDQSGEWWPVIGTARWDEFAPIKDEWAENEQGKWARSGKRELTGLWPTKPFGMIAKCAEAQALRKGWPEDLSGVYAPEEMARAEVEEMTASEVVEQHREQVRLAAVRGADTIAIQWAAGEPITFEPLGQFFDSACKFLRSAEHHGQVASWRDINRASLQEFWARSKSDALELKKQMEARLAALSAAEQTQEAG